jgi:DNA primase
VNDADKIKSSIDIVEHISKHVPLKKSGTSFKGLSPFKSEKTPSFIVNPVKNIWYDFSSGFGGDIIEFVMRLEGLDFISALKNLGQQYNIELSNNHNKENVSPRHIMLSAHNIAQSYFEKSLVSNQEAYTYLTTKRNISPDMIKHFGLGYGPDRWDGLKQELDKAKISSQNQVSSGLIRASNGKVFDFFRDRITFPIYNIGGDIIGYSARQLHDNGSGGKYINSIDTALYHKKDNLYGLYQAKESLIKSTYPAILVEGNFDVISLHAKGFKTAIATCGTAVTVQQLNLINRYTNKLLICMDNDSAGMKSIINIANMIFETDLECRVMELGSYKDPDELIQKDNFSLYLKKTIPIAAFITNHFIKTIGTDSSIKVRRIIANVLEIINNITDPLIRNIEITNLAAKLGLQEQIVFSIANNSSRNASPKQMTSQTAKIAPTTTKIGIVENIGEQLLGSLLSIEDSRYFINEYPLEIFAPNQREIFAVLKDNPTITIDKLYTTLPDHANYVKIILLKNEQLPSEETDDKLIDLHLQLDRLMKIFNRNKAKDLMRQISQAEESGNEKEMMDLLDKYNKLIKQ